MNIAVIVQFALATLLPVAACTVLMALRRNTAVSRLSDKAWQVLVGVVFGAIAIYGTEMGIPLDGAMMNVRDAAPLVAGLLFGGPAGIIAGVIGGVERWLAVMWGVGEFTRIACSLGTIFAGVYAALLRKFMFERHIPNLSFSFATGIVVEVLHLMLVFATNPDQPVRAFEVVRACAIPMTFCVGLSVMLASLVAMLLTHQPLITPAGERNVARILHARMLVGVMAAFLVTVGITAILQTNLARSDAESLLRLGVEDVQADIVDASDANLLALTHRVADALGSVGSASNEQCVALADTFGVDEIDVIDANGIIVASTVPEFVGFDMASGEQSAAFLVLLPNGGQTELAQSYQPIAFDASRWRKYAGVALEGGFVQVGYDAQSFLDDLSAHVQSAVKNRHIGQSGELVVIDEGGSAISTRGDGVVLAAEQLARDADNAGAGQLFTTVLAGEECYALYQEVEGYRIIAALPMEEANASRDKSVLIMAFMEVLVFAALFLVIYAVIKLTVVQGVRKMNRQLGKITDGDLSVQVDVRTTSEFASLSSGINKTVAALRESLATVKADLDMAADLQNNTLPDITSALAARNEFDLYATMEPAKEVGGDFYDFFLVDDDHLALVVADVSGKGVSAALFMMQSKTVIKMEMLAGLSPAEVLERANVDLSEGNDEDMFTTAWVGVLEISTGKLTYADAGHEKLALRRNGSWEIQPKPNGAVALASFDEADYAELPEKYRFRNHTITLTPGEALLQYTDGVTEATNSSDELFGEGRLIDALTDSATSEPADYIPFVHGRISEFVGDMPQFDDITMLGLVYKPFE